MFEHLYETRYGDYKDYDRIKYGSVIDIIQDVSTKSSASCGYSIFDMRDMHLAWLLKGFNIHFADKVRTEVPILACTAVKPPRGATSNRGCMLYQNGKLVAKSIADWFLFDTEKLKPVKIPDELRNAYDAYDFDDDFFTYRKPEIIENAEAVYSIQVANKDIDTNMHLNNQRGADLLMDALPYDFEFNNISILYKKPTFLGNELRVCMKEMQNGYYVHMKNADNELCVIGNFQQI